MTAGLLPLAVPETAVVIYLTSHCSKQRTVSSLEGPTRSSEHTYDLIKILTSHLFFSRTRSKE